MRLALAEAQKAYDIGEVPIGAVVVYEPINPETRRPIQAARVIAAAHNLRETSKDPSAHAEFLALKQASEVLDAWRLSGCTVYVTIEPCLMCAGLMLQSRIDRCVYGAPDPKAGAVGSLYSVNEDSRLNHRFEVCQGILRQECADIMRSFFSAKRKK
ncbi:MAG: nucleoside deaminase [Eggerthellaceae bacterium]|nr:nucleoside deaminase [Eggerthellaceae bacterium]